MWLRRIIAWFTATPRPVPVPVPVPVTVPAIDTVVKPARGVSQSLLRAAMLKAAPRAPQEAVDGLLALPPDNPALATPRRAAALIGQAAHESSRFTRVEEGLYYSAQRLTQVFPMRFPTLAIAEPFARNQQALANNEIGRASCRERV